MLEQIKPEIPLEAKVTKLKLSYFSPIMRGEGSLEKTIMLKEREGSRKEERSNRRWADSKKEATGMSLQELSRATKVRTWWTSRIHKGDRRSS